MRRYLLFCVFLLNTLLVWPVDFQRKVVWHQPISGNMPEYLVAASLFEGAVLEGKSNLPYWIESFELQGSSAEAMITNMVFEPFTENSISLPDSLGTELNFSSQVAASSGVSYMRVSVFPFVRRNNQILKLTTFTISVKENPNRLKSATVAYQWKSTSVLSAGKWMKLKVKNKGIYKITYDQLKGWGYPNPENVCLYGNGGYMLPVMNRDLNADDLLAYPVWKGKDNANKDCLFFYVTGNIQLIYNLESGTLSHQQNYYSTETYFYISDQQVPLLIDKAPELTENAGRQVISYPNYTFYEKESMNLINSGSRWFGEQFSMGGTQTVNISLDNPNLSKPATFTVSAAGRSSASSNMDVVMNGTLLLNLLFGVQSEYDFARDNIKTTSKILPGKDIQMKLTYNSDNNVSSAWLDYIDINYESPLSMTGDVVNFRGRGVNGAVQISEFILSGSNLGTTILNVTDLHHVLEMPVTFADGQLKFKSNSSLMNEYVAFNPSGSISVPELVGVGNIPNQNLHGADLSDMIIVANPNLLSAAKNLAAFHRDSDQMTVQVVTPDVIYNEFSGGLPDPSGLRNYFRMCYDRGNASGKHTLKYVLLMGDGSYDNRNIQGKGRNLIPTYQSDESLSLIHSFVTDDYFVMLDENEGGSAGLIDLGIGRIPANTLLDAQAVVNKVKGYRKQETLGNWRNMVTFIADDGNIADQFTNVHMQQAEDLANYVNKNYPSFFTDKIYFDTYRKILSAGGEKYPEVTEAIKSRVKRGTLVMNYTGHANERNLADEAVLDIGIIDAMSNYNRLPVFVTATCEYSRFDADDTSAGEHFIFNPIGGAIGLFSTTRLVFSSDNFILSQKFFQYIFQKDLRLGDVMRLAKVAANTGPNQLNFSLLADPALRLSQPELKVLTTSMDNKSTSSEVDTIKTLSVVTVKGFVADNNGAKMTSFNGEIIPTVYDKAFQAKTLGNAHQQTMDYKVQNNVIYTGLASVTNGEFEFSFFVPKDISYKLDKGKIIYYAYNETQDAQGYFDNFYVGGSTNISINDTQGPSIDLFMNSTSFKEGGQVSASSVLIANIADQTGINTAGIGIGHDITGILDEDYSNIMVLNDYFKASKGKYTEGSIVFPLTNLVEGTHMLTVKVWDVLNNSSEKVITFVVKDNFLIDNVHCFPNPMQQQTSFIFTHNQPDESFAVTLEIFETSGARVDILEAKVGSHGTESLPLVWNPSERSIKMKAGVYIYRITATTNRKTSSASGRLVYVYR